MRIAEGRDDGAQIIGLDAHVAVGDDEESCWASATRRVRRATLSFTASRPEPNSRRMRRCGKISDQFFKDRERGIAGIHAKNQFVIGIILAAEAGVIFVGFCVETFDRFQAADRRSEIRIWSEVVARGAEIADRAVEERGSSR